MVGTSIKTPGDLVAFLKASNARLLVNMFMAVGHVFPEVDNFVRRRALGQLPEGVFFLSMPESTLSTCVAECYNGYFEGLSINQETYEIAKKVAFHYPELTFDIGISSLKLAPDPVLPTRKMAWGNDIMYMLNSNDTLRQWTDWYQRRHESREANPLDKDLGITSELADYFGTGVGKLALLQVKDKPTTNVATVTEVDTYLPVIAYLKDCGYTVALAGREAYRKEFRRFGVLDYANSKVASVKHDLVMFKNAKVALTTGSGIATLADLFELPLVYANTWHLGAAPFSAVCNVVPTLMRNRHNGRLESFPRQYNIYNHVSGSTSFPYRTHEPRNPDGDDILAAVREVLEPEFDTRVQTPLQNKVKYMQQESQFAVGDARMSQTFLEKFSDLV